MLKGRCSLLRSLFLMGFVCCSTGCDQPLPGADSPATGHKAGALTSSSLFERIGNLQAPHAAHTATRLQDGRVLIVGGSPSATPASRRIAEVSLIAEIYDPNGRTFTRTGALGTARALHRAVLLDDGRVLVTGGEQGGTGFTSLSSAEVYRPDQGRFMATGSMNTPRQAHSATLLDNGQVLIVGGYNGVAQRFPLNAELYDPTSGSFLPLDGRLTFARQHHGAVRLQDGRVLIVGGISDAGSPLPAEIYDPTTGRFTTTGSLHAPRLLHQMTLLPNGQVLVTGGGLTDGNATAEAELYDPDTGTFSRSEPMGLPRLAHTATLLDSGRVLITGGVSTLSSPSALTSAELYDPSLGQFQIVGAMNFPRQQHTATSLGGERVLIAGGHDGTSIVRTAEAFGLPSTTDAGADAGSPDLTSCPPGTQRCLSDGQVATCNADGSETVSRCPADNDGNTLETCVPELGGCGSVLRGPQTACGPGMTCVACGVQGQPCCDGSRCTGATVCAGQICVPLRCDDGNPCTIDTASSSGCVYTPVQAGTVCRAAAGPCDVAEVCDGTGAGCPIDGFATGTVCRPEVGRCDAAERCTGTSPSCPADGVQPAGAVCDAGDASRCVQDAVCDGISTQCTTVRPSPAGTVCRGARGSCDAAERCDGTTTNCPADGLLTTATCPDGNSCSYCNGSQVSCVLRPYGHTCRDAAGPCDVAEFCDGSSVACPVDEVRYSGSVCAPGSESHCVQEYVCDGNSVACSVARPSPAGTICRPAVDTCDIEDRCDGSTPSCPVDQRNSSGVDPICFGECFESCIAYERQIVCSAICKAQCSCESP